MTRDELNNWVHKTFDFADRAIDPLSNATTNIRYAWIAKDMLYYKCNDYVKRCWDPELWSRYRDSIDKDLFVIFEERTAALYICTKLYEALNDGASWEQA